MTSPRKRLTPDERERIIELKLNRVPVRTIAAEVGCQTKTVQATWKRWLAESSKERNAELEQVREALLQSYERIATDARHAALAARRGGDSAGVARFLAEERQALREISRIMGVEAPQRVEHGGEVAGSWTVIRITEVADDE